MQIVTNASKHMLELVTRIHSQMKDIILKENPARLDLLVDQCMMQHQEQQQGSC
ncbi:hypothetical protein PAAL109150_15290 [Paenibacillus alkaliterrae]